MALHLTSGVGSVTAKRLATQFYSAERVFSQPYEKLVSEGKLSDKIALAITSRSAMKSAEEEMKYCEKYSITPIAYGDFDYPELLRKTPNPPYILFVQGDASLMSLNTISIVGTRDCNEEAITICDRLAKEIKDEIHNAVIVSGLAYGVDGHAHRAALKAKLPTIAVLPCPLPKITPSDHRGLAEEILRRGGALISEMHSGQVTSRTTFISRNRIVAGISEGTILIQSEHKGGAMRTMEIVNEINHAAFAVPGKIFDSRHNGCNRLISFADATLLRGVEDLIRVLSWESHRREKSAQEYMETTFSRSLLKRESEDAFPDAPDDFDVEALTEPQLKLLRSMLSEEPLHVNALEKMNPMAIHDFNVILIELELMGVLRPLTGQRYQRLIPLQMLNDKI